MLGLLRTLAIERVRQSIPEFDEAALDRWIMSTGYEQAGHPQHDLADLVFVYAASLTNTGGPKPDFLGFARLVRDGIKVIETTADSRRVISVSDLAAECARIFSESDHAMGGQFAHDIFELAQGRPGRPLMRLLLRSVVEFLAWLERRYPGAENLAQAFSDELNQPPSADRREVFDLLHELTQLSCVGVATAANFVKDSQVPALRSANLSALDARNRQSGWFAKPDLHVMRIMAMVTGRCDTANLQSLSGARARALFLRPPANGFSGNYPETPYKFTPDMRVIADMHEWASAVDTAPLEIDRILYLLGVRKTVIDQTEISTPCYRVLASAIQGALARGVHGKS